MWKYELTSQLLYIMQLTALRQTLRRNIDLYPRICGRDIDTGGRGDGEGVAAA